MTGKKRELTPKKILSEDDIAEIISRVADGMSLKQSCAKSDAGYANVIKRIGESAQLTELHARARTCYTHFQVQKMHDIAADPKIDVPRGKLMIDVIKWEAARILPKDYGEHRTLDVTATVDKYDKMTRGELDAEFNALLAESGMKLVKIGDIVDVEAKAIGGDNGSR